MPDDTAPVQTQALVVAPQPPRERLVTADIVPIYDSAKFEHYGRIATIMADATLVPDALRVSGNRQGTIANCFLVVNQADRWGMDPFAVAQCCSVVHGRLMYEGKLVAAVIRQKTGIEFDYHFTGERAKDDRRIYISDRPFDDEIVQQLEPGGHYRGWRIIDGSISEWRTLDKSGKVMPAWANLQQADMQLCYRAARVWTRLYEPSIMLGVYSEDEFDELAQRQSIAEDSRQGRKRNLVEKLPAPPENGFSQAHVNAEATKALDAAAAEVRTEVRPTETGPAPTAADAPASSASATPASTPSAAETSSPAPQDEPSQDGLDEYDDDADAEGLSDASDRQLDLDREYAETMREGTLPLETAAKPAASALGGQSAPSATDASPEAQTAPGGFSAPEDDPVAAFCNTVGNCATWAEAKTMLGALTKAHQLEPFELAAARKALWNIPARARDKVDPGTDPTAFMAWLTVAPEEDQIDGTLAVLDASDAWQRLNTAQQAKIKDAAQAAKRRIADALAAQ